MKKMYLLFCVLYMSTQSLLGQNQEVIYGSISTDGYNFVTKGALWSKRPEAKEVYEGGTPSGVEVKVLEQNYFAKFIKEENNGKDNNYIVIPKGEKLYKKLSTETWYAAICGNQLEFFQPVERTKIVGEILKKNVMADTIHHKIETYDTVIRHYYEEYYTESSNFNSNYYCGDGQSYGYYQPNFSFSWQWPVYCYQAPQMFYDQHPNCVINNYYNTNNYYTDYNYTYTYVPPDDNGYGIDPPPVPPPDDNGFGVDPDPINEGNGQGNDPGFNDRDKRPGRQATELNREEREASAKSASERYSSPEENAQDSKQSARAKTSEEKYSSPSETSNQRTEVSAQRNGVSEERYSSPKENDRNSISSERSESGSDAKYSVPSERASASNQRNEVKTDRYSAPSETASNQRGTVSSDRYSAPPDTRLATSNSRTNNQKNFSSPNRSRSNDGKNYEYSSRTVFVDGERRVENPNGTRVTPDYNQRNSPSNRADKARYISPDQRGSNNNYSSPSRRQNSPGYDQRSRGYDSPSRNSSPRYESQRSSDSYKRNSTPSYSQPSRSPSPSYNSSSRSQAPARSSGPSSGGGRRR